LGLLPELAVVRVRYFAIKLTHRSETIEPCCSESFMSLMGILALTVGRCHLMLMGVQWSVRTAVQFLMQSDLFFEGTLVVVTSLDVLSRPV